MKEDKVIFSPRAVAQAKGEIPKDYEPEKRRLNGAPKTAPTLKSSKKNVFKPKPDQIKELKKSNELGVFVTAPDSKHNLIKCLAIYDKKELKILQTTEPYEKIRKNTTLYKNVMLCLKLVD